MCGRFGWWLGKKGVANLLLFQDFSCKCGDSSIFWWNCNNFCSAYWILEFMINGRRVGAFYCNLLISKLQLPENRSSFFIFLFYKVNSTYRLGVANLLLPWPIYWPVRYMAFLHEFFQSSKYYVFKSLFCIYFQTYFFTIFLNIFFQNFDYSLFLSFAFLTTIKDSSTQFFE